MTTLLLFQIVTFLLYTFFIVYRYGFLESISESWYQLPLNQKFLFTLFTWCMGIPLLFYGHVLFFIAGAALCFVGTAARFKTTIANTKQIHFAGATIGFLAAYLGLGIVHGQWFPLLLFSLYTLLVTVSTIPNKLWWVEVIGFGILVYGFLI